MSNDGWSGPPSPADRAFSGLARNPAAPLELLLGLLQAAPSPACHGLTDRRDLPGPVQDAMEHHPSLEVRRTLAQHPRIDPEVRSRLLADPDGRVMVWAFGGEGQQPLSDDQLNSLLARFYDQPPLPLLTIEEAWGELLWAERDPRRLYRIAAAHPDPRVRQRVASVGWVLGEPAREALMADPVPDVRAAVVAAIAEDQRVMQPADLPDHHCHGFWAVLQRPLSRELVDQVVAGGDEDALYYVGTNPSTPPDVVRALLRHPAAEIRRRLATRADLSHEQLLELAADPEAAVRTAVSVHPGLTERERAAIDVDLTTVRGDGHYGSRSGCKLSGHDFVDDRVPPRTDAVRWARSVNPLLRRRAARSPELPADLVTVLADDPDLGVRVLLARHHPDAPPALLLRCFLEHRGCGRDQLTGLAQFPNGGMAAFADHTDPAVRCLVARDPQAGPEVVERLCGDPDLAVRRAMAACPRLPASRIIALLDDPELAEHAAANPALPVDRMHQILLRNPRDPN